MSAARVCCIQMTSFGLDLAGLVQRHKWMRRLQSSIALFNQGLAGKWSDLRRVARLMQSSSSSSERFCEVGDHPGAQGTRTRLLIGMGRHQYCRYGRAPGHRDEIAPPQQDGQRVCKSLVAVNHRNGRFDWHFVTGGLRRRHAISINQPNDCDSAPDCDAKWPTGRQKATIKRLYRSISGS
jgi:hypothetical protein